MKLIRSISFLCLVLIAFISNSFAYDLTDKFSIGGIRVTAEF